MTVPLTIVAKYFILDVVGSPGYTFVMGFLLTITVICLKCRFDYLEGLF